MQILIFLEHRLKLLARIEHCGMITSAKNIANSLQCIVHTVFEEVHSDLARDHVLLLTILADEVFCFKSKMLRNMIEKILITTHLTNRFNES